jgi:methionyl-tRNA synthetase
VKYCEGKIPSVTYDLGVDFDKFPFNLTELSGSVSKDMKVYAIHAAIFTAMNAVRDTNGFLTIEEPWKLKAGHEEKRSKVVRLTLEAIYAFTHFLAPVMPVVADKIFHMLGTSPLTAKKLKPDFLNLVPGTTVTIGAILFTKIPTEAKVEEVKPAKAPKIKATTEKKPKTPKPDTTASEKETENHADSSKEEEKHLHA